MQQRFENNLLRVQNIVQFYDSTTGGSQGRPSVQEGDLLRMAVVFLHASLEDLFRDLAERRLSSAPAAVLRLIPWPRSGISSKTTFDLGDLSSFRGQTVDDVIEVAVQTYLLKSNFNHPGDLKQMLEWVGLDSAIVNSFADDVGSLMARRHWIVHRGDRNNAAGKGQHAVRSISRLTVWEWLKTVEKLGEAVLREASRA